MELTRTHRHDVTPDGVIEMFADPDAVRARYEGMGHREVEILECARSASSLEVRSRRVVDVELPGFARKVLSPTNTMTQTDRWVRRDDGGWDGTFDVDVAGAPVEMSGSMSLRADGDCADYSVTIRMAVKVPLVGGKIADWVGKNEAASTLDAEFAAGDAWLAAHRRDG
jgi:hypothetical protein